MGRDAIIFAQPVHDPNDGGPRHMGVRPSYGLFLRHLTDSVFNGITLSSATNDDRPAIVLANCQNISFVGQTALQRGQRIRYDVGLRNSSEVSFSNPRVRVCTYPACPRFELII